MALLRFLSRVTFICNICFLLTAFIQWLPYKIEGWWVEQVVAMGYILAVILNVLLTVCLIFVFLFGAMRRTGIPIWLMIINFLFLLIQVAILTVNLPKK